MAKNQHVQCPESLTGEAKKEWARVTALLKKSGTLEKLDRGILTAYCEAWGTMIEAGAKLKTTGLVIKTHHGNYIPNPYLGVRNTALKLVAVCSDKLGMSPKARSHAHMGGSKMNLRQGDDILEDFDDEE